MNITLGGRTIQDKIYSSSLRTGRQIDVWREGQIDGETDRQWMNELFYRQTGGWTDRQMTDRQSNGEKDGETDRLMDG